MVCPFLKAVAVGILGGFGVCDSSESKPKAND